MMFARVSWGWITSSYPSPLQQRLFPFSSDVPETEWRRGTVTCVGPGLTYSSQIFLLFFGWQFLCLAKLSYDLEVVALQGLWTSLDQEISFSPSPPYFFLWVILVPLSPALYCPAGLPETELLFFSLYTMPSCTRLFLPTHPTQLSFTPRRAWKVAGFLLLFPKHTHTHTHIPPCTQYSGIFCSFFLLPFKSLFLHANPSAWSLSKMSAYDTWAQDLIFSPLLSLSCSSNKLPECG